MTRTPVALAALLLAGLMALAGCGEKKDVARPPAVQKLDVILDYLPNADHVGLFAAERQGHFKRAGLDVELRTPSDPSAPLKLLAAGKADLAISYEPELLLARDKGLRLVSVGAIVQKPLTSIMALGSAGIRSPADLAGKRVGTSGIPYQDAYLKTILSRAGADPDSAEVINVGFNLVPAMLSRKVDATLGAFWNVEGVELARRGKAPTIIRVDRAGVPTYNELILVARQDDLGRRGGLVRRFMRATGQGYAAARSNPKRAVEDLVKVNPDLNPTLQLAQVRTTLPVFFPDKPGRPFGFQSTAQWRAYGAWMRRNGLVERPPVAEDALTNEFLPGQGL